MQSLQEEKGQKVDFEQNRDLTLVWHRVKTVLEELSMVCHHKERVGSFWPPWEVCMDALQHSGPGQSKGDARQMMMVMMVVMLRTIIMMVRMR